MSALFVGFTAVALVLATAITVGHDAALDAVEVRAQLEALGNVALAV